jgi:16S rRNA (guanine527-N7)-methyltransferase
MSGRAQDFSRTKDLTLVRELAQALGATPDADASERLVRYVELVVSWNKKLDLTAARGAQNQLEVLLSDALVLSNPSLVPEGLRVVDVGTGAGAPALALALARPDLQLLLVEPLHKRVAFLRTVVGTLGCAARVQVVNAKLDPADPQLPGTPFDLALSRATFPPEIWVPVGLKLAPRTLALLAAQSTPEAPLASELSGKHEYRLPWSGAPRCIATYTSHTTA